MVLDSISRVGTFNTRTLVIDGNFLVLGGNRMAKNVDIIVLTETKRRMETIEYSDCVTCFFGDFNRIGGVGIDKKTVAKQSLPPFVTDDDVFRRKRSIPEYGAPKKVRDELHQMMLYRTVNNWILLVIGFIIYIPLLKLILGKTPRNYYVYQRLLFINSTVELFAIMLIFLNQFLLLPQRKHVFVLINGYTSNSSECLTYILIAIHTTTITLAMLIPIVISLYRYFTIVHKFNFSKIGLVPLYLPVIVMSLAQPGYLLYYRLTNDEPITEKIDQLLWSGANFEPKTYMAIAPAYTGLVYITTNVIFQIQLLILFITMVGVIITLKLRNSLKSHMTRNLNKKITYIMIMQILTVIIFMLIPNIARQYITNSLKIDTPKFHIISYCITSWIPLIHGLTVLLTVDKYRSGYFEFFRFSNWFEGKGEISGSGQRNSISSANKVRPKLSARNTITFV
uniref:G protein-coupled receptor n=1 Tax=Rhabditophanes sp. KR3021 TaxID=114890 RepID=A0AC35TH02_9BILA